jgi:hypothetical protein
VADDHVDEPERARCATARVPSVEPSSTTMISAGRRVCRCSEAIVRSSPEPPLNVGTMTLTAALPAGTPSSRRNAPSKASETSDKV